MLKKSNKKKPYTSYRVVKNGATTTRLQFSNNIVDANKNVKSLKEQESNEKEKDELKWTSC